MLFTMLAVVFFLTVLAFVNNCCALGGLVFVRPPSTHVRRSGVEAIEAGVVNWGNNTTPMNSAIIPVSMSTDGQCVLFILCVQDSC